MRSRWARRAALLVAVVPLAVVASSSGGAAATGGSHAVSGSISFDGVWTGAEAGAFGDVIKAFNKQYPDIKVTYKKVPGDNYAAVLKPALASNDGPDVFTVNASGA